MARSILILLITFILAASGILFWQWKVYSKSENDYNGKVEEINQQIIIDARKNEMVITHIFKDLAAKREYRIVMPDQLKEWKCVNSDEKPCESKDENPETFLPEKGQLQIQFTLPIEAKATSLLFAKVNPKLHGVKVVSSRIQVIDTGRREGTWIAGVPLQGFKKMEFVDYYVFAGNGDASTLYWQKNQLFLSKINDKLTIYSEDQNIAKLMNDKKTSALPDSPYLSFIHSKSRASFSENGISLVANIQNELDFERELVSQAIRKKLNGDLEANLIVTDVLSSMYLQGPGRTSKGQFMLKELQLHFTKEQLAEIRKDMLSLATIDAKNLDSMLSELIGLETSFFRSNFSQADNFQPLYFFDSRDMKVNGKVNPKVQLVYDQGKRLYPLSETLGSFGFKVEVMPDLEAVQLDNGRNQYRFYLKKNIFNQGNSEFGLLENPLIKKNGVIYIEQSGLQSIFKIKIEETEKEVILSK